ncbi:hypothetical protein [Streptomyces sp. NPDC086519]|uniref:hypothetical protein n=1 Tax=Streptomyces sp. NPDC086519 TaxID=3154863 RepID=UPI0034342C80
MRLIDHQFNCYGVESGLPYTSVVDDGTPLPAHTRAPELHCHPTTRPGAHPPHVRLPHGTEYVSTLGLVGQGRCTVLTGVGGAEWTTAAAAVPLETGLTVEARTVGMRADDVLGARTRVPVR